ncbi:MAG: hypothetical protein PQJ60_10585 [Spirochaetales bacterium]|nr:hypothetical protein [Spirochaetales bacterium]
MEGEGLRGDFDGLEEAVIDACSIIYLLKTGVFESLASLLPLLTTDEVYRETGWPLTGGKPRLPLRLYPAPPEARSHDQGLFLLARERNLPLISEDKEVLLWAEEAGLPYYNSLMMLIFLCYKGRISREDLFLYRERLLGEAHYGRGIVKRGEEFFRLLCEKG